VRDVGRTDAPALSPLCPTAAVGCTVARARARARLRAWRTAGGRTEARALLG
jgi:hypothetical protein